MVPPNHPGSKGRKEKSQGKIGEGERERKLLFLSEGWRGIWGGITKE